MRNSLAHLGAGKAPQQSLSCFGSNHSLCLDAPQTKKKVANVERSALRVVHNEHSSHWASRVQLSEDILTPVGAVASAQNTQLTTASHSEAPQVDGTNAFQVLRRHKHVTKSRSNSRRVSFGDGNPLWVFQRVISTPRVCKLHARAFSLPSQCCCRLQSLGMSRYSRTLFNIYFLIKTSPAQSLPRDLLKH